MANESEFHLPDWPGSTSYGPSPMAIRRHPRSTMQRRTAAWQSTRQEPRITSESCPRPKRRVSCTAACMLVQQDSALSPASRPTRLPRWPMA
eukprot:2413991-Pleurochrysis_carterae.AAC.1